MPSEKSGLPLLESARPTALKTSEAKESSSKAPKDEIGVHLDHSSCRAGTGEGATISEAPSERPRVLEVKEINLELPPPEEDVGAGDETGEAAKKGFNATYTSQGWKMAKAPTPVN